MTALTYLFGIASAVLALVIVILLLRRRRLRERHAIWWIIAALLALLVGVFPPLLEWASRLLGISVPTNLIFFVSIGILFLVCLQQAAEATQLESETRDLAERLALLDIRLRELEARAQEGSAPADRARPDDR